MPPRKRKLDADIESVSKIPTPPRWVIKPKDGDPLTRDDLQTTLLAQLFQDTEYRFTPPTYLDAMKALFPTDRTWSFAELYLDCLANSSKANKNLKDKMGESTDYAVSFAQLCFLINIGRMNTTLAFYPEMKTVLRTYHPIPCMQLDDYTKKNLQDAPRMKAQLKGCALPQDESEVSATLAEVLRRGTDLGWKPPSCVVVLLFLMMEETLTLTDKYFPEGYCLQDLFLPAPPEQAIPVEQRAKAFLYLVHRFLEQPHDALNDFKMFLGKLPAGHLLRLSRPGNVVEDVDSPEEIAFAQTMKLVREAFIEKAKTEGLPNPASIQPETFVANEESRKAAQTAVSAPAGAVFNQLAAAEAPALLKREASVDVLRTDQSDARLRPYETKILDDEYMATVADPIVRIKRPPGKIGQLVLDDTRPPLQSTVSTRSKNLQTALQAAIDYMQADAIGSREPWLDSDEEDLEPARAYSAIGFKFQDHLMGRKGELR